MEFLELAKQRYSVRSFSDKKVEKEKVERILESGRVAPTACNNQPQRVLVVQSGEALERWRRCTRCHFNEQLVLITCYNRDEIWHRSYDDHDSGDVDASIVTTHLMLEAWEQGIGSTWIMFFDPEAVRAEFNLPENIVPVSALAMGYAAEDCKPSDRHGSKKEASETIIYDTF